MSEADSLTEAEVARPKRRKGAGLLGWCITGHHSDCPHRVELTMGVSTSTVCGCSCHGGPGAISSAYERAEPAQQQTLFVGE